MLFSGTAPAQQERDSPPKLDLTAVDAFLENASRIRSEADEQIYREGVEEAIGLMGGHPGGFYMSHYIEQAGLREEMLRTFDSPFEFARLYNRAAENWVAISSAGSLWSICRRWRARRHSAKIPGL